MNPEKEGDQNRSIHPLPGSWRPKKSFDFKKKWLAYFVTLECANLFALKSGSLNTSTQYKMISADDDLTVSENWRYVTTRYLWQGPPNNTMAFKVRLKLIFSRLNKTFVLFWQKFPPTPFTNCIKALQCFIQVDLVISLWSTVHANARYHEKNKTNLVVPKS